MTAAQKLDVMLADLAARAQAARDFQCQSGLDRHSTRRLPKRTFAAIDTWRKAVAAESDTVSTSVVAIATAQRAGSADTPSSSPSADEQGATMPVSPAVAVRLDTETIRRLDTEAAQRGHTRSSLARHLIQQQLADHTERHDPEHRERTA